MYDVQIELVSIMPVPDVVRKIIPCGYPQVAAGNRPTRRSMGCFGSALELAVSLVLVLVLVLDGELQAVRAKRTVLIDKAAIFLMILPLIFGFCMISLLHNQSRLAPEGPVISVVAQRISDQGDDRPKFRHIRPAGY